MFRLIGGLLRCSQGRHERSEPHVHQVDGTYYSQCRYCRRRMRRLAKRSWVLDTADR